MTQPKPKVSFHIVLNLKKDHLPGSIWRWYKVAEISEETAQKVYDASWLKPGVEFITGKVLDSPSVTSDRVFLIFDQKVKEVTWAEFKANQVLNA